MHNKIQLTNLLHHCISLDMGDTHSTCCSRVLLPDNNYWTWSREKTLEVLSAPSPFTWKQVIKPRCAYDLCGMCGQRTASDGCHQNTCSDDCAVRQCAQNQDRSTAVFSEYAPVHSFLATGDNLIQNTRINEIDELIKQFNFQYCQTLHQCGDYISRLFCNLFW